MERNNIHTINMFRDSPWPGNILSNFADTPFVIDGICCSCSESFIQSLKVRDAEKQVAFCLLPGSEAWDRGTLLTESVFLSNSIWWRGVPHVLHSDEHFDIVKRGLEAKYSQSTMARKRFWLQKMLVSHMIMVNLPERGSHCQ